MIKKRSQNLRIIDFLKANGFITNRISMVKLKINNPFQRTKEIREHLDLKDISVTKPTGGKSWKIFYIRRNAAMQHIKLNNLKVA